MTRETAAHVAELAALLAKRPYRWTDSVREYNEPQAPTHHAARATMDLCKLAARAHRLFTRECNEGDPPCRKCDGSGSLASSDGPIPCAMCDGDGTRREWEHARLRRRLAEILSPFGLVGSLQCDPRGWPIALHASEADARSWEHNGEPRELLRVTPHA